MRVHIRRPGDPTIILDAIHELPQLEMKPDNSAVRLKDRWALEDYHW